MSYVFLPEDFEALKEKMEETEERIEKALGNIGDSVKESSETYHDDFGIEEGNRQARMWSKEIKKLRRIQSNAKVVDPSDLEDGKVTIGKQVKVKRLGDDKEIEFKIGSYMTFGEQQVASYRSPITQALLGATEGEVREDFNGRKYKIIEISN